MELTLTRIEFYDDRTFGKLYHGDDLICDILEDKNRGLMQDWELATIISKKIFGKTAIPFGRYEITVTYSNHFGKPLPLINDVKGFEGVRIHSGNRPEDTEGCLLCGVRPNYNECNYIIDSRITFEKVYKLIGEALLNEQVFINIIK